MKLSLFFRMVLVYLLIVMAVVLSFIGVFRYFFWQNYIDNNQEKMEFDINRLHSLLPNIDSQMENEIFSFYSQSNSYTVLIIDDNGKRLYGRYTDEISEPLLNNEDLQTYLSQYSQKNIYYGNYKDAFNNNMLIVSSRKSNSNSHSVIAIVYDTSLIINEISALNDSLWVPLLLTIFLGILLILWFNYRFSYPLTQMNSLAKDISKGVYDKRIQNVSSDELGQLSLAFNQMVESLANLDRMRNEFIASITHELRSPLTSIGGFIQGMLDGTVNDNDREHYLSIALDETKRLSSLINHLLDISKIEAGKFEMIKSEFDINELIRRVLISFENRINEKNIDIDIVLTDNKLMVSADSDRIQQVLFNILDNAVKFSLNNSVIKIKVWNEADKVYVAVRDYGPGIAPEDEVLIWNKFHTGNKSRTSGSGYGLGLSIIKAIIEQHNQQIYLNTKLGEGTTVTFSLEYVDYV